MAALVGLSRDRILVIDLDFHKLIGIESGCVNLHGVSGLIGAAARAYDGDACELRLCRRTRRAGGGQYEIHTGIVVGAYRPCACERAIPVGVDEPRFVSRAGFRRAVGVFHLQHDSLERNKAGAGNLDRFSGEVRRLVRLNDWTGLRPRLG